jgi:hypothetical protein
MSTASHFEFYIYISISPPHYFTFNQREQFERLATLYPSLGLLSEAVSGLRVLEVAVGSGKSSLYLASL